MKETRCKRRGKRLFFVSGIVGVVALATALVLPSCGRHGDHGRMSPERLRTVVAWHVNDFLDDIDATDAQRQLVTAEVREVLVELQALRDKHLRNEGVVRAELAKAEPDGERLHALFDEHAREMRELGHMALDSGLEVWAALDEEQRAELRERLEEHLERH